MPPPASRAQQHPNASFRRRLAAMIYDFFLIAAIWMLTTFLVIALLNEGEAVRGPVFQLMLLFEMFLFYGGFWHIKGQSLGMQVWKIKTVDETNAILTILHVYIRFSLATISLLPLGFGLLWMLFDPKRLTFYDRYSKTKVIYLGSKPYQSEQI